MLSVFGSSLVGSGSLAFDPAFVHLSGYFRGGETRDRDTYREAS